MDTYLKSEILQQTDMLNTQDNQNSIYKKHEVENSPMVIMEYPDEKNKSKYIVLLGNMRLSAEFETIEEALEDAHREDWERIIQVIGAVIELDKKISKLEVKQ